MSVIECIDEFVGLSCCACIKTRVNRDHKFLFTLPLMFMHSMLPQKPHILNEDRVHCGILPFCGNLHTQFRMDRYTPTAMTKRTKNNVRLSKHVVPTKYEISLTPDLEAFVFEGEETIHLTLKKPAKTVTLHSTELEIESAEILTKSDTIVAQKISYDEKAETATFTFKKNVPTGMVRLKLVFRGILNDRMHGFYRSSFEHEGKARHMATTQFESTDARRAFPCFDEPAMKAAFEVSLKVPSEKTAISNTMPIAIEEHAGGYKIHSFAPSPLMSTYLLAFIVGDFEHIEKKSKDGVLVRVFTTPGKKHQAEFALDCAARLVSFFHAEPPVGRTGDRARNSAPMVWQSRYDGVVDAPLAQRGVCFIHRIFGCRSHFPRVGHLDAISQF